MTRAKCRSLCLLAVVTLAAVLGVGGRALAHPLVDEARGHYEEADFRGALDALERAEAATNLTRADVIDLLSLRVLVRLALEDDDSMRRDIQRLLSLEPEHDFGEAPPEVQRVAETVRGVIAHAVSVEARARADDTGIAIEAAADHDPTGLVRTIQVHGRAPDRPWQSGEPPLHITGSAADFWAEAVGPGGAVLAVHGSADEPLTFRIQERPETPGGGGGGGGRPWLWVGISAGAAVAVGVVVTAVLVSSGGGNGNLTQPGLPMVAE